MSVETIVQQIDNEIANLTQARNVLAGLNGSSSKSLVVSNGRFSAASRTKMARAQKARWAKYRTSKGQGRSWPATQLTVLRTATWSDELPNCVRGRGMDRVLHPFGRDSRRSLGAFAP